jgi:hypothetical protein
VPVSIPVHLRGNSAADVSSSRSSLLVPTQLNLLAIDRIDLLVFPGDEATNSAFGEAALNSGVEYCIACIERLP